MSFGVDAADAEELGDNPTSRQTHAESVALQNPQLVICTVGDSRDCCCSPLRPISLQMHEVDAVSSQSPHDVSMAAVRAVAAIPA